MSAEEFKVSPNCYKCQKKLTLEEMHYYSLDGKATCEECEGKWMEEIEKWRHGKI